MITKSIFGRTNHHSTRTLFGAAALGKATQAEADATFDLLAKYGVNHVDTAASYGEAELRIGSWIGRHGKDFFLATKTGERTKAKAWEEFKRSLDRLKVDQVDLLQLHNLSDAEGWETAMGAGGALEMAVEARQQGLTRFVGVTGHGLIVAPMHLKSFAQFDFDTVLFPYSYILMQNKDYAAKVENLLALCQERNVAVQTIKSITRAPWGERERTHKTWYEPLVEQADINLAVHWVLGNPQVFLNTVGDITVLPKVLAAAEKFSARPSEAAMQKLLAEKQMQPMFV